MGYTVNKDGTITRDTVPQQPRKPRRNNSGINGCLVGALVIFLAVIAFLVIMVKASHRNSSYNYNNDLYDTTEEYDYYDDEEDAYDEDAYDEEYYDDEAYAEDVPDGASVSIERLWVDHNVTRNGEKGMMVHTRLSVENMKGETLYGFVRLFHADNVTPLYDSSGGEIYFMGTGDVNYDSCRFDRFDIFVPYDDLNMGTGFGSIDLSFDVEFEGESDVTLALQVNNQFTLSEE